jgi:hypothetical protein
VAVHQQHRDAVALVVVGDVDLVDPHDPPTVRLTSEA